MSAPNTTSHHTARYSSNSLLARAKRLGAGAALVLASQAPASAALVLDYSVVGSYSNSGWFTGEMDSSKADGIILPAGFKLWGSETRTDSMFWRYDDYYGETVPRPDTTGIAFAWGGRILGATSYDDVLSAPFDFSVEFTNLLPAAYPYVNVNLTLGYRHDEYTPQAYQSGPTSSAWDYRSFSTSYSEAGVYNETGNLELNLPETDGVLEDGQTADLHWFAFLTVDWNHEFVSSRNWQGSYATWNGDTLTVTIPQNSIDVTYTPGTPPASSVPDASSSLTLLGLGLLGLLTWHRRATA